MEDIFEKVKKYIAKYQMIMAGDTIAAGVSGGADSVCMLFLLWELSKVIDFRLLVVHVHHGVRMDADNDADYVENLCKELEVPYFYRKV
ncbi:MAG: tRNA(Ile)-lysidine synthetase, partial [Lachnospiraceae bacterium]|nr:tRNA(Ile)-lysidine synthetase [Lachnospiraceae bacterium]